MKEVHNIPQNSLFRSSLFSVAFFSQAVLITEGLYEGLAAGPMVPIFSRIIALLQLVRESG